jgi:hypothetical protein
MNGKLKKMKEIPKPIYGLIFGSAAGFVFSLITWGIDGSILAQSHAILPWLKFGIGSPFAIFITGLAGFLASKRSTIIFNILCFGTSALIISFLAGHLPYEITEKALQFFDPKLSRMVSFNFHEGAVTRLALATFISFVISVLLSFFFEDLVSQAYSSAQFGGLFIPLIIFIIFFAFSGWITDDMVNRPFRNPITQMNTLVQQARDIQSGKMKDKPQWNSWINSILSLEINTNVPYRIITETYDTTFMQVQLLLQFDQSWYRCFVMDAQPFYCVPYITTS